jgi:prolyl oligopeptidase
MTIFRCFASVFAVILTVSIMATATDAPKGDAASATNSATASVPKPPVAKVHVVEDNLHGVKIDDPYRWLEDGTTAETKQFVTDEMAYSRAVLDPLPGREKTHARLAELLTIGTITTPQIGGDYYFYMRREGTQNQPILYVRKGVNGKDSVLVDVNKLAADGTVALDWWRQSHDGKYVAYGTSPSGSEMSTLQVIETATGKLLPEAIERTRAASIAWMPDNSGFFYTRYPKKGEVPDGQEMYNRHVFYHRLGADQAKDEPIFGQGRDAQDWPNVELSEDGRWLAISVEQGWAKSEVFLKDLKADTSPVPVVTGKDFLYSAIPFKGTLYILTNEDAPRFRVFAVAANNPGRENWKEIVPQSDAVIKHISIVGGKLAIVREQNATSTLRLTQLDGKLIVNLPTPTLGSIQGIGGEWDSNELFFGFQSYTVPPMVLHINLGTFEHHKGGSFTEGSVWGEVSAPTIRPGDYEVKQVWYTSKDGTKVPMFVVAKKGIVLNGANPALLTGYGGFNVSSTPAFSRGVYLWLEHGGIFAVANLRGGSEFGEDWHRAGMLGKKQNVFDDFIAAAEYLIAQKYTSKDHLAIQGGSNGGLLMGAALTQRPDLFRAVVCQVPLLDMLRYQKFQIAKLWIPEYGSADDPEQFKWLYAYSPYHHVKDGTLYPSVLFMTADTDTRVDPMHAKKMAARMQAVAANGPDRPILLRIESKAGHGAGKPVSKLVEESTDVWSYLFWQLGMKP